MRTDDIFRVTTGGRIHLRVTGDPAGQPLFLMHSAGRSSCEFDALAALLGGRFHVVAWDMPGHGDSDRRRSHLSIQDHARLAMELCGALFARPAVIGGSSIGAALAVAIGASHGAAVAGLVPIELPLNRDGTWWRDNWAMVEAMFSFPDEPIEQVRSRFRNVTPDLALRLRMDRHKSGASNMMDVLWAGRESADDVPDQIRALQKPALFINGDRGVAPGAVEMLPGLNPAVELAIIADSGHFPQTDDPQAVAGAINRWADQKL